LPARLKKSRKVDPKQKNTFFATTAVRNAPESPPPVNFAATFWATRNPLEAKFYNGLQKNKKNN
jgi:hypothetical protein